MGGQTEFLYRNVEILLHHQPISFLGSDKSKNGKITGKRFPVFDYTGIKIVTIDA